MFGNARVFKVAQKGLGIVIPAGIARTLNITHGNRVEFDILNPRPELKEEPVLGRNFRKKARVNGESPTVPQESPVPEHVIERLQIAKKNGMTPDQLRKAFEETTDYEWKEIPEKNRKELETE